MRENYWKLFHYVKKAGAFVFPFNFMVTDRKCVVRMKKTTQNDKSKNPYQVCTCYLLYPILFSPESEPF